MGVDPGYQRLGIGGALLAPVLAKADAAGAPCYLETQTADNVRFYQRHGFTVVEKGEVPGQGWPMWAMLREPLGGEVTAPREE
jgi:GNAT superfamily N-acetyltransferase